MKNWVLAVGGLAVAGLGSLLVLRAPADSRSRLPRFRPACSEVVEPEVEKPLSVPPPVEEEIVTESDVAAPPEIQANPALLRDWLLAAPTARLGRLAGSKEMDRYVREVSDWTDRTYSNEEDRMNAFGLFLDQLNVRILESRKN